MKTTGVRRTCPCPLMSPVVISCDEETPSLSISRSNLRLISSSQTYVGQNPGPLSSGLFLSPSLVFLGHCSDVRPSAEASSFPRGVPAQPAAASCAALTAKSREGILNHLYVVSCGDMTGMQFSFFLGLVELLLNTCPHFFPLT